MEQLQELRTKYKEFAAMLQQLQVLIAVDEMKSAAGQVHYQLP
jgi:hypothetical protein